MNEATQLEPSKNQSTAQALALQSRATQEVQAALVIAKRFPRNEFEAIERIKTACKRVGLAECAIYSYPRGNATVNGPSIRLAETLAQNWGNIDCGVEELEQSNGESQVMAYAWDKETNSRVSKVFTVKHERHTRSGVTKLTDPRDIYEMVANQGSRRLRACILAVIPGDIVDMAVGECDKTLAGDNKEPLKDRVSKMVSAFSDDFQVSVKQIEARLGHNLDAISETELVNLRKIYRTLKDGMGKREDFFPLVSVDKADIPSQPKGKKNDDKSSDDSKDEQRINYREQLEIEVKASGVKWDDLHAYADERGLSLDSEIDCMKIMNAWATISKALLKK